MAVAFSPHTTVKYVFFVCGGANVHFKSKIGTYQFSQAGIQNKFFYSFEDIFIMATKSVFVINLECHYSLFIPIKLSLLNLNAALRLTK